MRNKINILLANSMMGGAVANVGDVAYWDGSKVKTVPLSDWNTSLGTPVGVVVIPTGFAPDGKARIVSLKAVDSSGNASTSHQDMVWGPWNTNTSLTDYDDIPILDSNQELSSSGGNYGYLPLDDASFAFQSKVDTSAYYFYSNHGDYIPSPYSNGELNHDYCVELSDNNRLSDFNGLSNTEVLVGLGSNYVAANAAYIYTDGASNTQWYLPSAGELGFLVARINAINNTISTLGEVVVTFDSMWSSTENSNRYASYIFMGNGLVTGGSKDAKYYVRPFATLESDEEEGIVTLVAMTTTTQAAELWLYYRNKFTSAGEIINVRGEIWYNFYGELFEVENLQWMGGDMFWIGTVGVSQSGDYAPSVQWNRFGYVGEFEID